MDPGLVRSLGVFFEIQMLLLCFTPDEEASLMEEELLRNAVSWKLLLVGGQGEAVERLGEDMRSPSHHGVTMVACGNANFSRNDVRTADVFASQVVWLVPDAAISGAVAEELPLNFNSNLLSFSTSSTEGEDDEVVEISETFTITSVKSRVTRTISFGTWTPMEEEDKGGGLSVPEPVVWERRSDLSGVTLVNTVLDFEYMVNLMTDNVTMTGLMVDVLELLQKSLNFRYG